MTDNPVNQNNLAMAALASCFAKALEEQNPGFLEKFEKQLKEHYLEIRDYPASHIGVLETLKWTSELIKS